jgi:hypothetical protein
MAAERLTLPLAGKPSRLRGVTTHGWQVAWVENDHERDAGESHARSVEGRRITKVRYYGLKYEGSPSPSWHADGFDALDYGVELDLDDGTTVAMIWKTFNHNEALLVYSGRLEGRELVRGSAASSDMSTHWLEHGPHQIGSLAFAWMRWEVGPSRNAAGEVVSPARNTDLCLQTVAIYDGPRTALITTGEPDDQGRYTPQPTNVAVFFSAAAARAAGVSTPG